MTSFYGESGQGAAPLILTAAMDHAAAQRFETMRRAYFPASRNRVPAHCTLFHALPGARREELEEELAERCWPLSSFAACAETLRFTGNGVSVAIACEPLIALRIAIAQTWADDLTPQDRQRFRPHVTVQNKVTAAHARETFDALQSVFEPFAFEIEGLDLWIYRGGPWERAGRFPFGGAPE